jgi:hypothetical protein
MSGIQAHRITKAKHKSEYLFAMIDNAEDVSYVVQIDPAVVDDY